MAVYGRSTKGERKRTWLQLGKSATQTGAEGIPEPITAGNPITWDLSAGNIAYDASIEAWTLLAGRVYRIDLQAGGQFSGSGGVLDVDLYAGTAGSSPATWTSIQAANKGPRLQALPPTNVANNMRGPPSMTVIYQVGSTNEQMRAVIATATSLTGIYRTLQGSSVSVQEL